MSDIDTAPASGWISEDTGPVYRLIYASRSCIPAATSEAELSQIFTVARRNNKSSGITGALMMHDDCFAQVLEGQEDKVRALIGRIQADRRHESVEIKEEGTVANRLFGRWAMAEVQDQGEQDLPMLATTKGLSEGAPWKVSPAQESVLAQLRMLTSGRSKGA